MYTQCRVSERWGAHYLKFFYFSNFNKYQWHLHLVQHYMLQDKMYAKGIHNWYLLKAAYLCTTFKTAGIYRVTAILGFYNYTQEHISVLQLQDLVFSIQ